jgi:hypothetical protein
MLTRLLLIGLLFVVEFFILYLCYIAKHKLTVKDYIKRLKAVWDIDRAFTKACVKDPEKVAKYMRWDMDRCFISGMLFEFTAKTYVENYFEFFDTPAFFHVVSIKE